MEEDPTISQNLNPNEVQEENYQNTEENVNVISNSPPVSTPISSSNNQEITNISKPNNNQSNFNTSSGDTNSMWYDFSIIFWFLFLCVGWNSFKEGVSRPNASQFQANLSVILFFILTISTIGFIIYFRNTTLNKNQNFINGFLGDMSKFHGCALFLVSCVLLSITQIQTKTAFVFGLIFSLLSVGSLIFIYLKMEIQAEWYEIITTKKGVFSCLIALSWYTFFYCFASIGASKNEPSENFLKGTSVAFSILVGFGNLVFAFFFKDLLVAIVNLLIYIELSKYFYYIKSIDQIDRDADGIIDIFMVIASSAFIVYLLFKERENVFSS